MIRKRKTAALSVKQNTGDFIKSKQCLGDKRMLEMAKNLVDPSVFHRFDSVPNTEDAVANDVMYNQKCCVKMLRETDKTIMREISLMALRVLSINMHGNFEYC